MQSWSDQILLKVGKMRALFACFFGLLFFRLAYLLLFLHPYHLNRAEKLPLRSETTPVSRGKVEDCRGWTLSYNAAVPSLYFTFKPLHKIPTVQVQNSGKNPSNASKNRIYPRREYINRLSFYLSKQVLLERGIVDERERELFAQKLRDFIYSQAALSSEQLHPLPFSISRDLYMKIKSQVHLWPGLRLKMQSVRHFATEADLKSEGSDLCVAPHILGFIGRMDPVSLRLNQDRLRGLNAQLLLEGDPLQRAAIEEEIEDLEGKMYRITDYVGQAGVERLYEQWLRGIYGHSLLSVNAKGEKTKKPRVIHKPKPPQSVRLTIDASLQLYCQRLLASLQPEIHDQNAALSIPWVKPASILVMEPGSGKVLAMASYPDFDGNLLNADHRLDGESAFKRSRYLGDRLYIHAVWDGREPLKQMHCNTLGHPCERSHWPKWHEAISLIAGKGSEVLLWFDRHNCLDQQVGVYSSYLLLQRFLGEDFTAQEILEFACSNKREIDEGQEENGAFSRSHQIFSRLKQLDEAIGLDVHLDRLRESFFSMLYAKDKVLVIDLLALILDQNSPIMLASAPSFLNNLSVQKYRDDTQAHFFSSKRCKELAAHLYERDHFSKWRQQHQNSFIRERRKEERQSRRSAKPYQSYLQKECRNQFDQYWASFGQEVIWGVLFETAVSEQIANMVEEIREIFWKADLEVFDSLTHLNDRSGLHERNRSHLQELVFSYQDRVRNWTFEQILLYESLMRSSEHLTNPIKGDYTRLYVHQRTAREMDLISLVTQSGYEPLSCLKNRTFQEALVPGSIFKVALSYEALCQKYKKGARSWEALNPMTFYDQYTRDAKGVVFVGMDQNNRRIPQFFEGGRIPKSFSSHIGQVDLLRALEHSSNPYFALLAAKYLEKGGQDLCRSAKQLGYGEKTGFTFDGETSGFVPSSYQGSSSSLYSASIGQDRFLATPLQTACMLSAIANGGYLLKPQIIDSWSQQGRRYSKHLEIRREIFLPSEVRSYLLEGMRRVATGKKGVMRLPSSTPPKDVHRLQAIAPYVAGKTSTAEVDLAGGISPSSKKLRENHIWFGAISFKEPLFDPNQVGEEIEVQDYSEKTAELVVIAVLKQGHIGRDLSTACYNVISYYKNHCCED